MGFIKSLQLIFVVFSGILEGANAEEVYLKKNDIKTSYDYPRAWTAIQPKQNDHSSSLIVVHLELLNKISGKRTSVQVPIGTSYVVGDIQIVPKSCHILQDSFHGEVFQVPLEIYLEQNEEFAKEDYQNESNKEEYSQIEPVLLYQDELSSNPRHPSRPIEHSVYDVLVKECY